ncbi:hypothetical protein B6N13_03685 [Marinomonas sp. UCMA 3892]|nr:hypothetical protein [Marinomonas sp. UCMA 3892]
MMCPFCLSDNACGVANIEPCWCFNIIVPREMLALLSSEQKDKMCVCRQCIDWYEKDRSGFLKKFHLS